MFQNKLYMPKIGGKIVDRKDLDKKLMLLPEYKLVFVTAPAGYGKTTSVAHFLKKQAVNYAWFSIDKTDNDPIIFWRYLIMSVSISLDDYSFSNISINKEMLSSSISINIFINMLSEISKKITLVLDDFHFIKDELIEESFVYFVEHLPQNVNILIISRKEPDNKLLLLQLKTMCFKIGINDLAFNIDELMEYYAMNSLCLNKEELNNLHKVTEGWAAGLVLSSYSFKDYIFTNKSNKVFFCDNTLVESYFLYEAFENWTEEVKKFMIYTSFLKTLTVALCIRVTENRKSEEIIETLSKCNNFVITVDKGEKCYMYLNLFRNFLLGKLNNENSETQKHLYCNAGKWFSENNLIKDAIECYIKAQEYDKAFELICNKGVNLFQQNDFSTSINLIESIPEELCEKNIVFCRNYSWILSMENQIEEAEKWAEKTQVCLKQCKEQTVSIDLDFMEANVSAAYLNLAIIKMDAKNILKYLKRLAEIKVHIPISLSEINMFDDCLLKTAYGFKGDLNKIDELYYKYINVFDEIFEDLSSYFAVIIAESQYERNDLKAVYATLSRYMGKITELNFSGLLVPCIILLAKEKKAKGCIEDALKIIESGKNKLTTKSGSYWMNILNYYTASLYICMGDTENAAKYIDIEGVGVFDSLSVSLEYKYIVYARYLMLINRLDESLLLLSRLEEFEKKENRLKSWIEILCLKAINHNLRGDTSEAMSTLDIALELGEEYGYSRTFIDEGETLAELLIKYRTWVKYKGEQKHAKYAKNLSLEIINQNKTIVFIEPLSKFAESTVSRPLPNQLSSRELEVLKLLTEEYSNTEIADELFITVRTVIHHNARIYEKLGVKNRLEAVNRARELRIF